MKRALMVLIAAVAAGWFGGCSCGGGDPAVVAPPAAVETAVPAAVTDSTVARLFAPATTAQAGQELTQAGNNSVTVLVQQLRAAKGNYEGMGYLRIIELLGESRNPEAVAVLCEVVNDRSAKQYGAVLPWAIAALKKLNDPRAVATLEGVLADPNADGMTKASAARVLTQLTGRAYSVPAPPPLQ